QSCTPKCHQFPRGKGVCPPTSQRLACLATVAFSAALPPTRSVLQIKVPPVPSRKRCLSPYQPETCLLGDCHLFRRAAQARKKRRQTRKNRHSGVGVGETAIDSSM